MQETEIMVELKLLAKRGLAYEYGTKWGVGRGQTVGKEVLREPCSLHSTPPEWRKYVDDWRK